MLKNAYLCFKIDIFGSIVFVDFALSYQNLISELAHFIIVYHSFMMVNQKDMEKYIAAAHAYFMLQDHSRSHLGQQLDHNRNISTSVVVRSRVGVITPKIESYQSDSFKGCFPISKSGPLLEAIFFFKTS